MIVDPVPWNAAMRFVTRVEEKTVLFARKIVVIAVTRMVVWRRLSLDVKIANVLTVYVRRILIVVSCPGMKHVWIDASPVARPAVLHVVMGYVIRRSGSTVRLVRRIVENVVPVEMVYAIPKMVRIVYPAEKIAARAPPIAEMSSVTYGVVKVVTTVSTIVGLVVHRMVARSHKIQGALNATASPACVRWTRFAAMSLGI